MGELRREHEADRHRLAVAKVDLRPGRVLARKTRRLEGVRQGVPVVQDHAATAFPLVAGDDLGLACHTTRHLLRQVQPVEILHAEEGVLGHLTASGTPLASREARQCLGVAEDADRLPERAHEILALREIDPGLATDGGVDLAEKRRRARG